MSGPASTLGGLSDSSQALMANTTAPATASTPNARRSRSAMGIVISSARARRWFTNWRADIATNTMTATTIVLSSTTAPCDDPNRLPLSRITIWMTPVSTVTPIATLDSRAKPRTAWTRSSSPGPASTTRASSTTPPTHTAIAMGVLHALAMAVWVGGVVLLARVVLAGPGEEDLVHAVRGFGRLSNVAIGVTVITGIVQMILLDGGNLFGSSHGAVVLLKTVVDAVMVFVAMSARQFVNQRLARANEMTIPMADRLRRAFGVEAVAGAVVLAMSAWLLSLSPPNVDAGPDIDYAIERRIEAPEADIDVTVQLT